ncbi:DUF3325 domain-containing protein [Methylobacterium oryzisoli]|uniref:DUF3325 domain-containing protein n=1 Tax=Methylobacterium oryzisoli TaxID=3385502 RepID=UPI00389224CD
MTPLVVALNLGLGFLGLCALCFSLPRHHGAVSTAALAPGRAVLLRAAGWSLILLSLLVAAGLDGWNFGPVQWLGSLIGAGLLLVVTLSYRPRAVRWMMFASALAVVAAPAALLLDPSWRTASQHGSEDAPPQGGGR